MRTLASFFGLLALVATECVGLLWTKSLDADLNDQLKLSHSKFETVEVRLKVVSRGLLQTSVSF